MGIVIQFPVETAARRFGSAMDGARSGLSGDVLILPVIRIERDSESNGNSPDEGTASGRGRRRRARS